MKKLAMAAFAATLLSVFFSPVSAATNTYLLDELELELTIPAGYEVITRDTSVSSEIFDRIGISGEALIEYFHINGVYLNAVPLNGASEEIVVSMGEIQIADFSALSDATLDVLASGLVDGYTDYGVTVSKYDIYQHAQTKFIRLYFSDTANPVHGLQYYTVYNEKAMNFTLRSYDGEVSFTQEKTIKEIVDSIKYNTIPLAPPQKTHADAFMYTDSDTGVTFTVPANWNKEDFKEEREYIDIKFVSAQGNDIIMYGSTDLWEELASEEQKGNSRSDLDSSILDVSSIASIYGIDEKQITQKTYGGKDYFLATVKQSADMYDTTFEFDMTYAIRIENGWGYYFQFGGTKDSPSFSDFEELLNSVDYSKASKTDIGDANTGTPVGVIFIVVALLIGAVIVVGIIVNKRDNITEQTTAPKSENLQVTTVTVRCPSCAGELPPDSRFCHICGTKLI